MNGTRIEFVEHLSKDLDLRVDQGHRDYEASHGIVCDYQFFWILIRNERGETLGVLAAYTAYAEIYVDDMWVDPNYRMTGLGRTLLEALEARYKEQGYNNINLVTHQFQAVAFYLKCGFEVEFVRINKNQPKLTKTFFVKFFGAEPHTRGLLNQTN